MTVTMIKRSRSTVRVLKAEARGAGPADASPGADEDRMFDEGWVPDLDLTESSAFLTAIMEASGLEPDDLVVALRPGRLEIKGRKRKEKLPPGASYLRLERGYGPFRRVLALPCEVVPGRTRAGLENGLLIVTMAKARTRRTKEIIVRIQHPTE